MSQISSRPRVQSVTGAAVSLLVAGGVVMAAALVKGIAGGLKDLARQAKPVVSAAGAGKAGAIDAVKTAMAQFAGRETTIRADLKGSGRSQTEAARLAALRAISESRVVVDNPEETRRLLSVVASAPSMDSLQEARTQLLKSLATSHARVLAGALRVACERACVKSGFDRVQSSIAGNVIRVIASDSQGRTLASEIRTDAAGELALATEVVGVSDGSCREILDTFDTHLNIEGVRSGPPNRKSTGGVCELAAARDFLRKGVPHLRVPQAPGEVQGGGKTEAMERKVTRNRSSISGSNR